MTGCSPQALVHKYQRHVRGTFILEGPINQSITDFILGPEMQHLRILISLLYLFGTVSGAAIASDSAGKNDSMPLDLELRQLLSKNASIVHNTSGTPRWSEFDAPSPGTIVNVATEDDVLVTVKDQLVLLNAIYADCHIGSVLPCQKYPVSRAERWTRMGNNVQLEAERYHHQSEGYTECYIQRTKNRSHCARGCLDIRCDHSCICKQCPSFDR